MDIESNYNDGKINAGLATGIIGTALGVLNGGAGILGAHGGSGSGFVTKESNEIQMRLIESERNNAILSSELSSEKKMVEVFNAATERTNAVRDELSAAIRAVENKVDANAAAQAVINANVGSQLAVNTSSIAQLFAMTKLVIPNANICPGWDSNGSAAAGG